ncbi:MAG: PIG-L deacetylase family protein [Actinomycetes bacterium]
MSTVVVVHAHPDDEAIFTGGTIALLAAAGHRVVVVYATSGELGAGAGPGLAEVRREEARAACELLGAERVVFLDHHDSGTSHDPADRPLGAFAGVSVVVAADHLAAVVEGEQADALITYDAGGVYPHPDHVHVHRVGATAAGLAGLLTWYEVTVDREYLHFVDTHVAALAGEAIAPMLELGSPTVEITNTVDVRSVLGLKLAAIAEHRTQVQDPTFGAADRFPEVYGYEWFIRHGQPGPVDELVAGAGLSPGLPRS